MEVLVEYEYIAVEEDELTIRRGDVISNVERLSDGWMEGDMDGRRGAFPDNFVKVIKEAQPQEVKKDDKVKSKEAPKKAGGHVADLANKLGHQGIKMGPPPNGTAAKVTKRDQSRRKLRAKVAFSYAPANDDELRLEAGDVVEVIKQEEEGWWEGSVNGKTGMFPSNFVEVVAQEAEAEDKNSIANDKDRSRMTKTGVGLGDIFKDGPISLRPTGEKPKPAPERTEPRPLPTVKPEEKTGSLKKNPPVKLPPALPPKDVTESKKASPITDADERFPMGPGQRERSTSPSSAAHLLESIPELDTAAEITNRRYSRLGVARVKKAPNRVSHVLDSFYYSEYEDDEEFGDCPHGDDFDHTSMDDEGCQYSPSDDDFYEMLNSESLESTTPVSSSVEKEVKSPMSDLRVKCMNVNFLDGRKSGASRTSSGSDIPIDVSELSQTRATPPPKFTFRKRRAKGTPNTPVTKSKPLQTTSVIEAEKPPRKRPRKFLSTTGVVWTTSMDPLDKDIVHCLYNLNTSAPEGYQSPPNEFGAYSEGQIDKEAEIWATEFSLKPKKHPSVVRQKKSVSFASKDNLIDQQSQSVSQVDDTKLPLQSIQKRNVFKSIDVKKITDSVELNKEKMKSGKWRKAVDAKNKKIQTTEEFLQSPILGKGTSLRKSLSERISAVISPSLRRSKTELSLRDSTTPLDCNIDDGTTSDLNDDDTLVSEHEDASKETGNHIDVVSATSKPLTDVTERVANLRRSVYLEQPPETTMDNAKPTKSRWSPIKKRISSPLSRFRQSRFNLRKKVSPLKLSNSPLKQEIINGNTYVRMPGVEPTYLETLKDMGRLSPSVRQLSQRYCLFQKGNMSRSLDFLATSTNSRDNINDVTASLPQLSDKYAHFTTDKEDEPSIEVIREQGTESAQITGNLQTKTKGKRSSKRFSFLSGFGTWPRRVPSPDMTDMDSGYAEDKSPEPPGDERRKETQDQKGRKRKRFSLLRPRSSGDSKTLLHVYNFDTSSKPKRSSLFNSLRRRFSMKKDKKTFKQGMATEYSESYDRPLEILTDDQCLPTLDHFHKNAQCEMRRRSNLYQKQNHLWKVESSPEHGEKWIALKDPSLAHKLSRRSIVKSEGYLPHSPLYQQHSGDDLQETEHIVKYVSPKKTENTSYDAFWSRVDQGIGHEEVVDLDDYVVVDDLNQLVHDKSLEDTAEALVQEAIWKAMGDIQRQKFNSPAAFNSFIWSQSRRAEPAPKQLSLCDIEKIAESVAVTVLKDASQGSIPEYQLQAYDNKPLYYRMMTGGFQSLAAEVLLNNEGNQGVNMSNNNTNVFNDGGMQFINMNNSTDKCDDCSELMDLVDTYFGQNPSPITPQQVREMQQRMHEYVKYHEDHMTSRSAESPSAETQDNTCSSLTPQREDSRGSFYDYQFRHDRPRSAVAAWSEPFNLSYEAAASNIDQKPAGSTFYGTPEPLDTDAAEHVRHKPAGSMFHGTPEPLDTDAAEHVQHKPAGSTFYGTPEPLDTDAAEHVRHKPAGSMFHGTPEPLDTDAAEHVQHKPAGSTFYGTPEPLDTDAAEHVQHKPAGSMFHGTPEPLDTDAAEHVQHKPAGSTFYGTPEPLDTDAAEHVQHKPAGSMFHGTPERLDTGAAEHVRHKPAGSMFHGTPEPLDTDAAEHVQHKPAGSMFHGTPEPLDTDAAEHVQHKPAGSMFHGTPEPLDTDAAEHVQHKPAGSMFHGTPEPLDTDAAQHVQHKPAGSTFYGTPERLDTGAAEHVRHKPAGSMFYGDMEPTHDGKVNRRHKIDASPVHSRVAGSYFIIKSPWEVSAALKKVKSSSEIETSTPKSNKCRRRSTGWWINIDEGIRTSTFRPTWNSPGERPIGIHFGTPSKRPMVDASPIPKPQRRSVDDQPVGVHYGFIFEANEEQRTEDDSKHFSMGNDGGFPLSKSVAIMHLATANTSVTENLYHSLNGTQSTINFSPSSIVDQLP